MGIEPRFHGIVSEDSHRSMSRIRGKDTSIEVTLRKKLWAKGYRYRKNYKRLPGKPDIVLTKYALVVNIIKRMEPQLSAIVDAE